jgi:allophanate hydrolase subunit 2
MSLRVTTLSGAALVVDGSASGAAAADVFALVAANAAVNNGADAAAVEVFVGGIVVVADAAVDVAVGGAEGDVVVTDASGAVRDVDIGGAIALAVGDRLDVRAPRRGLYRLLAVAGGVGVGVGESIAKGDTISVGGGPRRPGTPPTHTANDDDSDAAVVRIVAGGEVSMFAADALEGLLSTTWQVSPQSSRLGTRLLGGTIPPPPTSLVTTPVWTGAVQITPSGEPIVLGPQSKSTGGYHRLAQVIAVDRHKVAQRRPGLPLRFVSIDLDEARALRRAFHQRWGVSP